MFQCWRNLRYAKANKVGENLSLYLFGPENGAVIWSVDVAAQFTLLNEDKTKNHMRKASQI